MDAILILAENETVGTHSRPRCLKKRHCPEVMARVLTSLQHLAFPELRSARAAGVLHYLRSEFPAKPYRNRRSPATSRRGLAISATFNDQGAGLYSGDLSTIVINGEWAVRQGRFKDNQTLNARYATTSKI